MASIVGICNSALRKIGLPPILSLTEGSPAADQCNAAWDYCRDDVLRQHRWPCAVARVALARLETTPTYGYAYTFQLPADCLRLLEIDGEVSDAYRVEGRYVLSDAETLNVRYIKRVTDPNTYDANLAEVLALRLAWEIVFALTGSATQQELSYKVFQTALAQAKLVANDEQGLEQTEGAWWVDAR